MSPLLIALLGVVLIPLFVAKWRTSLIGLGCQGVLMAAIAHRLHPMPTTPGDWLTLADLIVVRGIVAPLALYTVLRAQRAPARNDVIPANLLSWTLALGLVLVAFSFSQRLVADAGDQRTLVAVAAAGVLLGFLILATQSTPVSQMIGALQLENAIALLELGGAQHESPIGLQVSLVGIFIATVIFFRWYLWQLTTLSGGESTGRDPGSQRPTR